MAELTGKRIAVAGAGVFGLCTALRAAVAGAIVEIWDPAALADNASGVAAGMIAPVGEILFDGGDARLWTLFQQGAEGWRVLEQLVPDLQIERSGAVFLLDSARERDDALAKLQAIGAEVELERMLGRFGLFTLHDWRLNAPAALAALRKAVLDVGGVFYDLAFPLEQADRFDAVVIAAGYQSSAFQTLAPELTSLSPIKGQVARFQVEAAGGTILRTADLYITPQPAGLIAGATMEFGHADLRVDDAIIAKLRRRAIGLMPELAKAPFKGFAGVRAATPDGLPLAGPSRRAGVHLATGARRNGWLLAPLVSQIALSYLSGGDGGPFAAALDPRRFA